MKAFAWAAVAAIGLGVMMLAYYNRHRNDSLSPWAHGVIVVGPENDKATKKLSAGKATPAYVRLLPADDRAESMISSLNLALPSVAFQLQCQLRPKLIAMSFPEAGIAADSLQSGRLPEADRDEVLAGPKSSPRDQLKVGDRVLQVVGVLKPGLATFGESFLIRDSAPAMKLFPSGDPSVHRAILFGMGREDLTNRRTLDRQLEGAFPSEKYAYVTPPDRLARRTYDLYLAGQAIFLVGGSGVLIGLYRGMAGRVRPPWFAAPFQEIARRPALVWGVHLVYFGLVMVGSLLIYELPDVQDMLVAVIRAQLRGEKGPLGAAGQAYGSGNILYAAAVTFVVNYFLGTIAMITLPSMVLPGIGLVVALVRPFTWGIILSPTSAQGAGGMLPHSVTMLLEGEGYILAAFFALLIPIYLFQVALGGTALGRFGRAVRLNIQASALVALVLAIAACYEAIEVIQMMR